MAQFIKTLDQIQAGDVLDTAKGPVTVTRTFENRVEDFGSSNKPNTWTLFGINRLGGTVRFEGRATHQFIVTR